MSYNRKSFFASLFQTVNMKPIPQQRVCGGQGCDRIAENSQAAENKNFLLQAGGFFSLFFSRTHTRAHMQRKLQL